MRSIDPSGVKLFSSIPPSTKMAEGNPNTLSTKSGVYV
jgi:hypothetical protein